MRASSESRIRLFFVVFSLALTALFLAGCGDDDGTTTSSGATAAATGETSAEVTSQATGDTGQTSGEGTTSETGDGGTSAQPESKVGDEEAARTPVTMTVAGNRFTAGTARNVHVPSFIAIELDVTVEGPNSKTLLVTRPGGAQKTFTFPGGERSTRQIEGLRPGRSLIVAIGRDRVTVVADAEPGP